MPKLIIVGGGAAGFYAAIQIANLVPSLDIHIYEKSSEVLSKVKISGGGRCNVTHHSFDPKYLSSHYPRGGRELIGPFTQYNPSHVLEWFESRGVKIKSEADGRMFPITDSSETIIQCFLHECARKNIKIHTSSSVQHFEKTEKGFNVFIKDHKEHCEYLLITTGSSQTFYEKIKSLGHTIHPPVPSLFTFMCKHPLLEDLAGISLPMVEILVSNTKLKAEGPILITHRGVSGPAVLRLSAWGARLLHEKKYSFDIQIKWLGSKKLSEVEEYITQILTENPHKQLKNLKVAPFPSRLWERICSYVGFSETTVSQISQKGRRALIECIYLTTVTVNGKNTFKEEFVTCGGVSLKEVNMKTFESKVVPNLYFAGEVLDIDAITGGFNFQAAWTGAALAAKAIACDIEKSNE